MDEPCGDEERAKGVKGVDCADELDCIVPAHVDGGKEMRNQCQTERCLAKRRLRSSTAPACVHSSEEDLDLLLLPSCCC